MLTLTHPDPPRVPQADITLRNKDGLVAFMVATKEGHDTIKEKLQPVRQNLIRQLPEINTAEQFLKARLAVKDYGLQRLKHEMGVPPHHDIRTSPLVGTQASPAPRPETELCPILTSLSHVSSRAWLRGQEHSPAHNHR